MRTHIGRLATLAIVCAAIAVAPSRGSAQSGITMWAGAGNSSTGGDTQFSTSARQAAISLGLPVIPLSVRGDALLLGSKFDGNAISYSVNAMLQLRLPIVQPYVIAGKGRYALSLTDKKSGYNAGVGVRLGLGRLGVFGEVRRHQPLDRSIVMFGLTF